MTSTTEHKEFSQDNRYTIRLKPRQKEWADKTEDAAEQIRTFIDSQIQANRTDQSDAESKRPLDFFEIRALMRKNLERIKSLQSDHFFVFSQTALMRFEYLKNRELIFLPDIDQPASKKLMTLPGSTHSETVLEPPDKEFVKDSPELAEYLQRCRNVVRLFETKVTEHLEENRALAKTLETVGTVSLGECIEPEAGVRQSDIWKMSDKKANVRQEDASLADGNSLVDDNTEKTPYSSIVSTVVRGINYNMSDNSNTNLHSTNEMSDKQHMSDSQTTPNPCHLTPKDTVSTVSNVPQDSQVDLSDPQELAKYLAERRKN